MHLFRAGFLSPSLRGVFKVANNPAAASVLENSTRGEREEGGRMHASLLLTYIA